MGAIFWQGRVLAAGFLQLLQRVLPNVVGGIEGIVEQILSIIS